MNHSGSEIVRNALAFLRNLASQRSLPFNDVFHAIIARDNKAVMITRDFHFEKLSDIVESMVPEDATF